METENYKAQHFEIKVRLLFASRGHCTCTCSWRCDCGQWTTGRCRSRRPHSHHPYRLHLCQRRRRRLRRHHHLIGGTKKRHVPVL